ncbi:MAG TPA: right-handed parallel beta-helix repeat-containing protein [Pseudoduganella sp.]
MVNWKTGAIAALAMLAGAVPPAQVAQAAGSANPAIYVDCSASGAARAEGTQQRPIRSLEALNAIRFKPGTHIYFKRGVTCFGSFKPAAGSSGAPGAPIVVDAYGEKSAARPAIAAGCRDAAADPLQQATEAKKTPSGISPYHSLCRKDDGIVNAAALHLHNVDHWEINALELSNDGLAEAGRVGLLVQLEDFGTGSHYRINDVYVHHVHGYLEDRPEHSMPYKATGGILFHVTREGAGQRKTKFDDVVVENSEIFNVDGIGLATRSAWMCRPNGAPCGDYPPYKGKPAYLAEQAAVAASEYYPSTKLVLHNNKIHNVGGDGIVVRTAAGAKIESNLLYDIWMRAPGNSAGAWAINTDNAEFSFNEIHGTRLREHIEPGDGMAFDADMGTRNTRFYANYSHDNAGGMMLFCGCGNDGLGQPATASDTLVERNLSLNDGRRIIAMAGSESALVRDNLIVTDKPGVTAPLLENIRFPTKNAVELRGNRFVHAGGQGTRFRTKNPQGSDAHIVWGENEFLGFDGTQPAGWDTADMIAKWMVETGFVSRRYQAPK